jgi:Uma2 family endonuclease
MFSQREMTAEEFLAFAEQYPDKRFDFIDGEIVEASPKRLHSRIQTLFTTALELYTRTNPVGLVHTEAAARAGRRKFIPDVSVNEETDQEYFTLAPLVAVEIRSDTQSAEAQRRAFRRYIKHGTPMVILVLPRKRRDIPKGKRSPWCCLCG